MVSTIKILSFIGIIIFFIWAIQGSGFIFEDWGIRPILPEFVMSLITKLVTLAIMIAIMIFILVPSKK